MEKRYKLFHQTIEKLGETGLLEDIILIGSWCLYFYRILFENAPQIPAIRTMDIDFLVPNPPKIRHTADIPAILDGLGFIEEYSQISGNSKFIHPELEIEFIIPEKGKGKEGPHHIKEINVNAQGLRYVSLLQSHTIKLQYEGYTITIPEPAAFVLHKIQISGKRTNINKKEKDLETARELGDFLLTKKEEAIKLKDILNTLPEKWKKELLMTTKKEIPNLNTFLLKG